MPSSSSASPLPPPTRLSATTATPLSSSPSPFLSLPHTILEDIAFHLVASIPLGPPTPLLNLLLTAQPLARALSFHASPHLYARIYKHKFDLSCLPRRSSPADKDAVLVVRALAARLRTFCDALKAIKKGKVQPREDASTEISPDSALHVAFVMLVENDGRNAAQLLQHANVKPFAERYVRERVWAPSNLDDGWPREGTPTDGVRVGEALWVWWLTTNADELAHETEAQRRTIMDLVRPFVVHPGRYPVFHAPDALFDVAHPPPPTTLNVVPRVVSASQAHRTSQSQAYHAPHAHTRRTCIPTYEQPLHIPAAIPARLIYFARSEATAVEIPGSWPETRQPLDPQAQPNTDLIGRPTRSDLREFNALRAAKPCAPGTWDRDEGELSERFDLDWVRWRHCWPPSAVAVAAVVDGPAVAPAPLPRLSPPPPTRTPYTLGTLSGPWFGRSLIPDRTQYLDMVLPRPGAGPGTFTEAPYRMGWPQMNIIPLSFTLEEYVCLAGAPASSFPFASSSSSSSSPKAKAHRPSEPLPSEGTRACAWTPAVRVRGGLVPAPSGRVVHEEEMEVEDVARRTRHRYVRYKPGMEVVCPRERGEVCAACERRAAIGGSARSRTEASSGGAGLGGGDADGDEVMRDGGAAAGTTTTTTTASTTTAEPDKYAYLDGDVNERLERIAAEMQAALPGGTSVDWLLDEAMRDAESAYGVRRAGAGPAAGGEDGGGTRCAGYQDVLLVGSTHPRHALAWHAFRFWGRVRAWDGLCVIVSAPAHTRQLACQVFRGYVCGGGGNTSGATTGSANGAATGNLLVGEWRAVRSGEGVIGVGNLGTGTRLDGVTMGAGTAVPGEREAAAAGGGGGGGLQMPLVEGPFIATRVAPEA